MPTEIVKAHGSELRLHYCSDKLWRWNYYRDGKRMTASAKSIESAKIRAKEILSKMRTGKAMVRNLSTVEASLFEEWLKTRKAAPPFSDIVADYLKTRKSAELSEHHIRTITQDLTNATKHFTSSIASISTRDIEHYLDLNKWKPRRRNNVRQALVSVFKWCRDREILPDQPTAAQKVMVAKEAKTPVTVFTPEEIRKIFELCPSDWIPAIAIQAFAGIRTEEVSRLVWGNVKLKKKLIEVPASASKTGDRRLVPIQDNLLTFLDPGDSDALIAPIEGLDWILKRLRKLGVSWKKNGLRHSFGSYRCAATADVPRVAYEMGNSVAMVKKHYLEAQELETAIQWFSVSNTKAVDEMVRFG